MIGKKFSKALSLVAATFFAADALPNYPGAEGFGADTKGGRGGRVIAVTNTNASGAGSFAAALLTPGPRIIVFRTSGVIVLNNMSDIAANTSFVTVAGQTSPGGITIAHTSGTALGAYHTGFHDGVFRFLRFRGTNGTYDNISLNTCYNMVWDHCDFSGSSDEAFDITFSNDFTVSWCTIANSGQGQTYGALIAYAPTSNVSLHHNLFAHHVHRGGPHMHWGSQAASATAVIQYINNICYDNVNCRHLDCSAPVGGAQWNFVGNYFKAGPNTDASCQGAFPPANIGGGASVSIYHKDNHWVQQGGQTSANVLDLRYSTPTMAATPFNMPAVTTYPVQQSFTNVLNKVGAWPRDSMNARTIREVKNGTGQLRNLSEPKLTTGPNPPADADLDGMPDYWETGMGFNVNDSSDSRGDHDNDGYTNIEEYINDLALVALGETPQNPGLSIEEAGPGGRLPKANRSLTIAPNPYSGRGPLNLKLSGTDGIIQVADIRGKIVRTLPASSRFLTWEGGESAGRLGPGLYLVRWTRAGGAVSSARLMVTGF